MHVETNSALMKAILISVQSFLPSIATEEEFNDALCFIQFPSAEATEVVKRVGVHDNFSIDFVCL